jgi:HK97 family phage portal protein
MGILTNKLGIRAFSMEDPAQPLLPYSALMESLGMGKSDAGVMVNEKQAMRLTTAYGCIMIISSDLSTLPLSIFQGMPDGSIQEATTHRLYPMLHDAPNEKMSSTVWRGAMLASVLGWGNAYSLIRRDRAARPVSLNPLPSDRTCPALVNGELIYMTTATVDGLPARIDPDNMIHIMGMSQDGLVGLSPIGTCKNAFGLALAAEKFGAQFFGNGARATGVLTHPETLDAEAYENLKKSVREQATGESALRPLILEEGMTWQQMTIAPNDAQFLQTRQYQRSEIAALFRVPLHLLQDLQRATNNNIEHQSLDYLRYTLRPWAVRLEEELRRKLLNGPFHCQHDFNEFQRGDFASQTAGFALLRNWGVYSSNDILKKMRENPISAEEGGDLRIVPFNMTSLEKLAAQPVEPVEGGGETTDSDQGEPITDRHRQPIVNSFRRLFRDAVGRIVNRKEHDQQFAHRTLHPVIGAMLQNILASKGLRAELTEDDKATVNGMAGSYAARSQTWTRKNAAQSATELTQDAYYALNLLIGES